MPDPITPALTAEEWAARRVEPTSTEGFGVHDDGDGIEFFATNDDGSLLGKWKIDAWDESGARAVAALLLADYFTWQDVDDETARAARLEQEAQEYRTSARVYSTGDEGTHTQAARECEAEAARYRSRAARIAALLPPRQG